MKKPKPKGPTRYVNVPLSADEFRALQNLAQIYGRSNGQQMRAILREFAAAFMIELSAEGGAK